MNSMHTCMIWSKELLNISQMKVVLGTEDLDLAGPYRTERNVSEIVIHPLYNGIS